jgi:TolB-like protein/Tfp pilus assembly protein PilF
MGAVSAEPASTPTGAVFLSYASQDAEAAQKICEALRAAGIEVWFDQSELRGGDAWDQSIRKQIKSCALFVPVISQHTHERAEGYFRLEWKLAVDRCHLMAADKAFLVPVVIDDTPDDDARVPEKFRDLQWTRLPEGDARPEFVTRIQQLLSGESGRSPTLTRAAAPVPAGRLPRLKSGWRAVAIVLAALAAYLLTEKPWTSKPAPHSKPAASTDTPVAFNPPPHSIAVLPFVNMSGDPSQEYFSDGLTEELLNSLARINGLQVAARTSAFSFKGKDTDIDAIARKLNVSAVLEGSVRRSAHTVRIIAQLDNAVTGFHLWSQTYDRDLGDVLKLQAEIANAVASALEVTLLGELAARVEVGGTQNPAALDAYLRASKVYFAANTTEQSQAAIAGFTEAIHLEPQYALAFAGRSSTWGENASWVTGRAVFKSWDKAQSDALRAIALAPELAEGHSALATYFHFGSLNLRRANEEYERALALAPGNARLLGFYGLFAVLMGRTETGIAAARRAVQLDPLNSNRYGALGAAHYFAHQYKDSMAATDEALARRDEDPGLYGNRGIAYYALRNFQTARSSCEIKPDYWLSQVCLAITYDKVGRHADAEAMLAKLQASMGDARASQYGLIYAQWGDTARALDWLDTAMRLRQRGLAYLKTDPRWDPIRNEPRF